MAGVTALVAGMAMDVTIVVIGTTGAKAAVTTETGAMDIATVVATVATNVQVAAASGAI